MLTDMTLIVVFFLYEAYQLLIIFSFDFNFRKWLGIERSLDNAVKRHKEDKIPKAFKSRLGSMDTLSSEVTHFHFCLPL